VSQFLLPVGGIDLYPKKCLLCGFLSPSPFAPPVASRTATFKQEPHSHSQRAALFDYLALILTAMNDDGSNYVEAGSADHHDDEVRLSSDWLRGTTMLYQTWLVSLNRACHRPILRFHSAFASTRNRKGRASS
jgi:hypothetical protein